MKRICISVRCPGLIIHPLTNSLLKRSRSQRFRTPGQARFPGQKKRLRYFEISFVGANTFSPFGGKEEATNLAIHLQASGIRTRGTLHQIRSVYFASLARAAARGTKSASCRKSRQPVFFFSRCHLPNYWRCFSQFASHFRNSRTPRKEEAKTTVWNELKKKGEEWLPGPYELRTLRFEFSFPFRKARVLSDELTRGSPAAAGCSCSLPK